MGIIFENMMANLRNRYDSYAETYHKIMLDSWQTACIFKARQHFSWFEHRNGQSYYWFLSLFVSDLSNIYPLEIPEAVTILVDDALVGWLTPGRVYIWGINFLWSEEGLKLFWVVEIWQSGHFYYEIIQISLPFNRLVFIIFVHDVFRRDGGDEASRPAMDHCQPQCMELTKPAINSDFSVFIVPLDDICCVFGESRAFGLIPNNS